MAFNLLELHDSEEDKSTRQLLRVYNVLAKHSPHPASECNEQAVKMTCFLQEVNEQLKKEYSCWTREWVKAMDHNFARKTCKDWLVGRASPPLIALKKLENFGYKKEVKRLINNSNYFSSTTNRPFTIPHKLSSELAYLIGAILGDGHIRKTEDDISFEVAEKWLAEKFMKKFGIVFNHYTPMNYRMDRGKLRYVAHFGSKPATRFFARIIGIPRGKKSHIIVVPEIIKEANKRSKLLFWRVFLTQMVENVEVVMVLQVPQSNSGMMLQNS